MLARCKLSYVAQPDLDLSKVKLRRVTRAGMRKTPEFTCDALEDALTQYFGEHWRGGWLPALRGVYVM